MPSPNDCDTLQAIFEGVEHVRAEAEAEWGASRLPLLVDDLWRAKFRSQARKWSDAYREAWAATMLTRDQLDAVNEHAGGMKRAYVKLAALASEAGHRPLSPEVWETTLADGSVAAIVRTDAEAAHVIASGRHVNVFTLAEIANVIDALPEALRVAKVTFPGAKVLPPRTLPDGTPIDWRTGDEIPFGSAA